MTTRPALMGRPQMLLNAESCKMMMVRAEMTAPSSMVIGGQNLRPRTLGSDEDPLPDGRAQFAPLDDRILVKEPLEVVLQKGTQRYVSFAQLPAYFVAIAKESQPRIVDGREEVHKLSVLRSICGRLQDCPCSSVRLVDSLLPGWPRSWRWPGHHRTPAAAARPARALGPPRRPPPHRPGQAVPARRHRLHPLGLGPEGDARHGEEVRFLLHPARVGQDQRR